MVLDYLPASSNISKIPMSLPGGGLVRSTVPVSNPVNHDQHIKQTIDRLRCIQKHLKNPMLFSRTIRELIDWCSDPRAFRPHFHQCLFDCLAVVDGVEGNPGFDLDLSFRLFQMCYEQRDKFSQNAASLLTEWCTRAKHLIMTRQHHGRGNPNQHDGNSHHINNHAINSKVSYPVHMRSGKVSDPLVWNQTHRQQVPHTNQHPSLSVITTATVWGVSTTQTPPVPVRSQSSSTSYAPEHMNLPGNQMGGQDLSSYPNNYTNKPKLNEQYQQHGMRDLPPGKMIPQTLHMNAEQSHHSSAAAAAAAAVAAAAAAATATATATATFIKEQQDQNQMNCYDQVPPPMPPSMNGPMYQQGAMPHQAHPQGPPYQGSQHNHVRSQLPFQYGRSASVPTTFPASSPRPLTHTPSYSNDNFKPSGGPQQMSYASSPFNNNTNLPNPLKTPDIFSNHQDVNLGYCTRNPELGSNNISQYPSSHQMTDSYLTHGNRQHLHNINENAIPGNPTPPLTPGSNHNAPPYPSGGMGLVNEHDGDEHRLTFPVRDGIVLQPFRLEHNLSVSNHAFHLREHVHKTLFERPDLDLQFKCFHNDDRDRLTNWPHSVQVRVNSTHLSVPRGVGKEFHKPLYLKSVCKPGRNNIEIGVSACCCSHYFVLQLVHRPSIRFVLKGLMVKRILPDLNCRTKIKRSFISGNVTAHDIIMNGSNTRGAMEQMGTVVQVSLLCPITGNRIKTPARGQDCKHIQCFDLEPYLKVNSDTPTWVCPICGVLALLELLEVDEFMQNILKSAQNCHQVSIDSNCNWFPLSGYMTSFPKTMSGHVNRGNPVQTSMKKQEAFHRGVKQEPGCNPAGFGSNRESYISALTIKNEPRRHVGHIKPDPDGLPHKRIKSSNSPGINLTNLPAPSPGSAGGCSKAEHGTGFPQPQKFHNSTQRTTGSVLRPGPLMVADMKEYVAANDMVPIEKRINPAVTSINMGLQPGGSPKLTNVDGVKSCAGPGAPRIPHSSSEVQTPHVISSPNCPASSPAGSVKFNSQTSGFQSETSNLGKDPANPVTPVVTLPDCSEINIDALVEHLLDDTDEKGAGTASSLGFDPSETLGEQGGNQKSTETDPNDEIMELLSDLGAPTSSSLNVEEENILSFFDGTS